MARLHSRARRRTVLTLVVALGFLSSATSAGATSVVASSVLAVYTGTSHPSDADTFAAAVGHRVHWAMATTGARSWSTISTGNPSALAAWGHSGYQMIWAVPMLPTGVETAMAPPMSGVSLAIEATGAYDPYFTAFGTALVANNMAGAVVRFGWEFNGNWTAWSALGHRGVYIDAFRQIVHAFRQVPGQHFSFEWNPNPGDRGLGDLANFYPGDVWVTYVGLDVYDINWRVYPGAKAEWQYLLSEPYGLNWLAGFASAHHKPIVIPEFGLGWGPAPTDDPPTGPGVVQGGDDGYFITKMAQWCAANNVVYALYFLSNGPISSGRNPDTLAALRASW